MNTENRKNFTVDEARLIQLCLEFANNDDELLDRFKDILYEDGFDGLPDNILGSIWDKLNIILKPTERLFPYIKCPKCNVGHVEEGEDYSYDTHIAYCNSSECKQEYWIGYTREYNLETMEEPS